MKQINIKNLITATGIVGMSLAGMMQVNAQGTSLTDFEVGSKGGYGSGSAVINGNSWLFNEALTNTAENDMKNGTAAARLRYSSILETSLTLETEMPDITEVSFFYARSNFSGDREGVSPTIVAQVGNGSEWTSLDTLELAGVDALTEASYDDIEAGNGYFRIIAIAGDEGKRFNIDDITIVYGGEIEPPTVDTLTELSEDFAACSGSGIGAFTQFSDVGDDNWHCIPDGRGGSPFAARMNGGFAAGESDANYDLLISVNKYDFSELENPSLSFWNKKQFEGTVTVKVQISTDYDGLGAPMAASWVDVATIATPGDDWTEVSGISLEEYKSTPFFLAFTYECGTDGAFAYFLDDIKVVENLSIFNPKRDENKNLIVLGEATTHNIQLQLTAVNSGNYSLELYDLNGRKIYSNQYQVLAGTNNIMIQNAQLVPGMYMVKVQNPENGQVSSVKAIVK